MALKLQHLPHYLDFDATSESGLSEISYVHPYALKRVVKVSKSAGCVVPAIRRRGARATRRSENDAFLNTLSVLSEADIEETSYWPDSVNHPSAFTKLFEDDSIRAVWDLFISLSETEQAQLLKSLRPSSSRSDDSSLGDNDDYDDDIKPRPHRRRRQAKQKHRHSKPGPNVRWGVEVAMGLSQSADECGKHSWPNNLEARDEIIHQPSDSSEPASGQPPVVRSSTLPPRLIDVLYNAAPKNLEKNSKNRSKKWKRSITALDFCLIAQAEEELRQCFRVSLDISTSWTPTVSLLGEMQPAIYRTDNEQIPNPLQLDAFDRLLVHCVADYLGLLSYSAWSDVLSDRQLWVERPIGCPFSPPLDKLVNLLKANFLPR